MRYREILIESDNRTRKEKLLDLINHPSTEQTLRLNALRRLQAMVDVEEDEMQMVSAKVFNVKLTSPIPTNISEEDLEKQFSTKTTKTCYQIISDLTTLSPPPRKILFFRGGNIELILGPPFTTTAAQYVEMVKSVIPGIISTKMSYGEGSSMYSLICKLR